MQTLTVEKKKEEINEYQKELVTEQMENLCINSIEIYIQKYSTCFNIFLYQYTLRKRYFNIWILFSSILYSYGNNVMLLPW